MGAKSVSNFGVNTLALVTVVGLAGPLLASVPGLRIPVVIGELAAGLIIGRTGLGIVDPADPTFTLLANVGFALVMFVVGTHVPIRDATLRSSIPGAALRGVLVGVVATVLAGALATVFHTGHAAVYAVLMASSSAALALPVIQSLGLTGAAVQGVTAQIAIADATCIVLLPLVIDPKRALSAAHRGGRHCRLRGGAVRAAAGIRPPRAAQAVTPLLRGQPVRPGAADQPDRAVHPRCPGRRTHVSIMLAGFAIGLVIRAAGEPRRLARQLFGITEGLFSPLFFVWLGASLQVRELGDRPAYILLGLGLGVGAVLAHCAGRLTGQPLVLGALAAAQLGVPVAAATLGTEQHLLSAGEPSALLLGALVTVAVTSVAGVVAGRRQRAEPTSPH